MFDKYGAYLEVCDAKMKALKDIDFRVYNGIEREILQSIQQSKEEEFFQINWDDEGSNLYLKKYPRLLELLRQYNKLVDKNNTPITFTSTVTSAILKVIKKDDKLLVFSQVIGQDAFEFLTPNYVLVQNEIHQVHNVGDNFEKLKSFDTTVTEDKLEELLTILVTYFENIDIQYENYLVEFKDEKRVIKPAVIFEKITADNELVLRTSATVGNLSPEFFNDFNISKIVLINAIESTISIYECDFSDVFEIYGTIFSKLNALKRAIKTATFSEEDGLFVIEEELSREFILKNLQSILGKAELFGSEKLKSYKYNTTKPTLNVSFKEKIDFLDSGDVSISIGEESFSVFDMINLYKPSLYSPISTLRVKHPLWL